VAAQTASAGVIPSSRTASATQNGIDDVNDVPGLQSVASATVTPASSRRRASGYGERVENSTPGSSVATVADDASASTSAAVRNVQWSTLAAPSSTPSRTPGPAASCPACTRTPRAAARPASSTARASSASNACGEAGSQNTSTQRACGAHAASIGPVTRRT
jgi:hypothetical protein